jgi:hypothetical protein
MGEAAAAEAVAAEPPTGVLTGHRVNVRTEPTLDSDVLFKIDRGQVVEVLGEENGFYLVNTSEGGGVYIYKQYVYVVPDPISASAIQIAGLIEYSKRFLGVRYVMGGGSPSGFDCTGFIVYVLKNYGFDVELSRTPSNMAKSGADVAREDIQPGDLLFFSKVPGYKTITHAALYIGDNKMIHAETKPGITITDIDNPYYACRYVKAKRIL